MKDQYFGDFGDYQKISLLKKLQAQNLFITTYWMKTKDDSSTDGKHVTYLDKPELWEKFESEIYSFIYEKVATKKRLLSHIEESTFCSGIRFISNYIEDTTTREYILESLCSDTESDIIFFDPDNGIEVASTNKKNLHKYVMWNEIISTYNSGKSVLVYQHFSRVNREVFIKLKKWELSQKTGGDVIAVQVKHSVYFFVLRKEHEKKVEKALKEYINTWESLAILR